jgi:hypothetical protein
MGRRWLTLHSPQDGERDEPGGQAERAEDQGGDGETFARPAATG